MAIQNKKVFEMLLAQHGREIGNYYFYLNIAAHYENKNYRGFAKYFRDAANEEKEHADKVADYLFKKQYKVNMFPMPEARDMPNDMTDEVIAEARLEIEEMTSEEWNAIYETAKGKYGIVPKNGKMAYQETEPCEPSVAQTIATEFIQIQDSEEQEANDFLARVRMASNILILDKELME